MFTGLIEAVGKVAGITQTATGLQVHIESTLVRDLQPGDSLAVNGVCLTAAGVEGLLHHVVGSVLAGPNEQAAADFEGFDA